MKRRMDKEREMDGDKVRKRERGRKIRHCKGEYRYEGARKEGKMERGRESGKENKERFREIDKNLLKV